MTKNDEKRVTVRMTEELYDQLKHFASREDVSVNQFMLDSIKHYINWILTDYDVPTAETQRLNQLIATINDLIQTTNSQNNSLKYFIETFFNTTQSKSLLQQDVDDDK